MRRIGPRANQAKCKENIQQANATDNSSKGRMKNDRHEQGEMTQKIVLFPKSSPREIEQQRTHFNAENYEQRSKNPVHEKRNLPGEKAQSLSDGFLKGGNALGDIPVIDVHRIDLGKTLERRV